MSRISMRQSRVFHTERKNTNVIRNEPVDLTRFRVLASDEDGTLTRGGHLGAATRAALERWRESGRLVFLTTGETPKDLAKCPHLDLIDVVIAENGAAIFDSATKKEHILANPPPARLLRALHRNRVTPLKRGRVIIGTEISQTKRVLQALAETDIDWQMIRNRHELMLLPRGVDKASGLRKLLQRRGLKLSEVIAFGDAENDVPLMEVCGCGVAVANAVPVLKRCASVVTKRGFGSGVVEIINGSEFTRRIRRSRQSSRRRRL